MLVLSRHRDERIMVGDDIVITVIDIRGDKVRIGIDAPKNTIVHREEIYEAIRNQQSDRKDTPQKPASVEVDLVVNPT